MKCPETERIVPTVLRMSETAFQGLATKHAFRCPSCDKIHSWEKQDAWLERAAS